MVVTKEEFLAHASQTPVALEAGNSLPIGQPVRGTDKNAIYFVVAVMPGLTVAMRWKGAMLSVRMAGTRLNDADFVTRLKTPGIFADHLLDGGYFSAHLGQSGNIEDLAGSISAQMLYASVLAAIGSDLGSFTARAPYGWRSWASASAQAGAEAKTA